MCVCTCVRITCKVMWVLEFKLRLSGLIAGAFTCSAILPASFFSNLGWIKQTCESKPALVACACWYYYKRLKKDGENLRPLWATSHKSVSKGARVAP